MSIAQQSREGGMDSPQVRGLRVYAEGEENDSSGVYYEPQAHLGVVGCAT